MINFNRVGIVLLVLALSGCSTVHNAIGPDKPVSPLRAGVEAPVDISAGESPLCKKPEMEVTTPTVTVAPTETPYPFAARVFFLLNQAEFTSESAIESSQFYRDVVALNPTEVLLVGHTDTSASAAYNDALSLRRVERVKRDLIKAGIAESIIRTTAAGEHRLLVATPDNTVEMRNRRVEIFAR